MAQPSGWSTQQLAEFVAVVSSFETETAATLGAVERAAEAFDAEVAAIVRGGEVVASVGYPAGSAPVEALDAVARGDESSLPIPGAGLCPACAAPLDHPADGTLIVARSADEGLSPEEVSLLHGMARVTSMTLRLLRLLEQERSLRSELAASRKRMVTAADEMRRRIERNLHDGTQQRLVTLGFKLRGIQATLPEDAHGAARSALPDRGRVGETRLRSSARSPAACIPPSCRREGSVLPSKGWLPDRHCPSTSTCGCHLVCPSPWRWRPITWCRKLWRTRQSTPPPPPLGWNWRSTTVSCG